MKSKKELLIVFPIIIVVINMILVATGNILALDTKIWNFMEKIRTPLLTNILLFFTNFGSTTYIVIICILLLLFFKYKKSLINLYGVLITSTVINNVIKIIYRRPRPSWMGSFVDKFESTFSFPSGHSMAAMTLYGFLIYMIYKSNMSKTFKILLISLLSILILSIGVSRIYIGVHYFSDVITGFLCSIIIIYLYLKITKKHNLFIS